MTTISTVGTLVNSSVTASQSTVSITTVNAGDLVVANIVIYGNIQLTAVSGGNTTWYSQYGPGFNATLGVTAYQVIGITSATGTATVTLSFSSSIGTTKVQRTIQQLTAGTGVATEWWWYDGWLSNAASTTLTYPNNMAATPARMGYYPYAVNGTQATASGVAPFAYVGYGIGGSTGSAGSTSGFTYTVDANSGVLAVDTAVTQGTTPAPTANLGSSTVSVSMGVVVMPVRAGAAFLTQSTSGLRVALEIAWGANLTDLTGASWVWTDVTGDVLMDPTTSSNAIKVTLGSPNDTPGQQTNPSQMTATLLNPAGQYSLGGQSPNYPNVVRNVPVRLRIFASGSWQTEYQGGVASFQPAWDATGKWATAVMTASGPLRRLNQGTLYAPSTMYTGTMADSSVVAYWPLEDGQQSTFANAALGGSNGSFWTWNYSTNALVSGGVPGKFASYSNVAASAPMLTMALGGQLILNPSSATSGSNSTTSALFGSPTSAPTSGNRADIARPNTGCLLSVFTPNGGSIKAYDIAVQAGGVLTLLAYPAATRSFNVSTVFTQAVSFNLLANADYEIGLTLSQSGGITNWTMWAMSLAAGSTATWFTGSQSNSGSGAQVNSVNIGAYSDIPGVGVGHVVVRASALSLSSDASWAQGYPGEALSTRLTRLANEGSIPLTINHATVTETSANAADTLGPQYYDTLANLLRECESTGQGVLLDGLNAGLTYNTRQWRESQQPTVTVDASAGGLAFAFEPVDDDQNVCNDVTVTRRSGTSATYQLLTGPNGVNTIGDYQNSITVNPSVDTYLAYTAQWLVNQGAVAGYRYPNLQFALEFNPSLIPSWLQLLPFGRLDVTNITSIRTQLQNATVKTMVTGWTEDIDLFSWHVTANCVPYDPWRVITLAAATGSTSDTTCWLDTDGSQLASAASAGATSISVTVTAGPRWVTTADTGGADNFPFYINVGGYQVQVTNVTGTGSTQTFTVAALPAAFPAGAAVSIWDPPVLAM